MFDIGKAGQAGITATSLPQHSCYTVATEQNMVCGLEYPSAGSNTCFPLDARQIRYQAIGLLADTFANTFRTVGGACPKDCGAAVVGKPCGILRHRDAFCGIGRGRQSEHCEMVKWQ